VSFIAIATKYFSYQRVIYFFIGLKSFSANCREVEITLSEGIFVQAPHRAHGSLNGMVSLLAEIWVMGNRFDVIGNRGGKVGIVLL
jgi:hypothetical protein